jgi:chloramphenicol O-acetyltransferase type B
VVRGQVADCGPGLKVNYRSEVNGGRFVRLGANVNFNGMLIYGGGGLSIGDNFHSGRDCRIITENHRYEGADALPYDSNKVKRPVTIGDNVWLGDSVIVLPGVTIGDGAVVGAGSVVTGKVDALSVVAGNPSREVKRRDAEEYRRLVEHGRFH